jgi:hypothetical protein
MTDLKPPHDTSPPLSLPPRPWTSVLLPTFLALLALGAIISVNYRFFFTDWILPEGDFAADDILIVDAKHLELFHGNYSRIGFYHPGPFYLEWMAIFEILFIDISNFLASTRAAHVLAIVVLYVVAFGVYFRVWLLWSRRIWIALMALLVTLAVPLWGIQMNFVTYNWPPFWYLPSAVIVATGLIGLVALGISWLPWLIFGLLQLIHGHASFIGIVPLMVFVTVLIAVAFGKLPVRVPDLTEISRFISLHRTPSLISVLLILIFALPIAIQTVEFWPGELPKYFAFASGGRHQTALDAARYILAFIPASGIWAVLFIMSAQTSRLEQSDLDARFLGIVCLVASCLPAWVYAWRGIDKLSEPYLVFWILPFVGTSLAIALFSCVQFLANAQMIRAIFVAAIGLWSLSNFRHLTAINYDTEAARMTLAAFERLENRTPPGKKIALQIDRSPEAWGPSWPEAAALLSQMKRQGKQFLCIEPNSWHLVFSEIYRCDDVFSDVSEHLYMTLKQNRHNDLVVELPRTIIVTLQ